MNNHADIFMWVAFLLICPFLIGYLLGSIPFGLILTRLGGAGDIRKVGSGNIGATNVLRTGHKGLAAATLLGDALKGTVAVLLAWKIALWTLGDVVIAYPVLAALGAFLGHLFPVWLKFKGGKGVATFLGCLMGLCFPAALVFAVVWLCLAFTTRYSSLAALLASAVSALSLFYFAGVNMIAYAGLIMVALLWWKHKDNIKRLLAGTEGKIGQKG